MSLALSKTAFFGQRRGPVVVVVMDGIALGPDYPGNAVRAARKPVLDRLMAECPWTTLQAHGTAVGLPSDADMGNSEVGHNALGAGRVFDQGAKLVNTAIASGALFRGQGWNEIIDNCLRRGSTLHCIGLLSDGNVHSHIDHLKALIVEAKRRGVRKVAVHALLDGRDVGETSALEYTEPFEAWIAGIDPNYGIASGGGRMVITMDRYEANWGMVELGWKTHVLAEGRRFPSASAAVRAYRAEKPGVIDQDLPPFVVERDGQPFAPIRDGDSVVFFNFRGDRAIEISKAFVGEVPFQRRKLDVCYAGMMTYDGDTNLPPRILVEPPQIDRVLSEYLAHEGVPQLAVSETQKYGHVTYFWNGNRSGYIDPASERYIEVPSDRVPFEQRPWMKAAESTDALLAALEERPRGFARINYANGDMVGHTGVFEAARMAVEAVDLCLGRLIPAVHRLGGCVIVTADHGNADEMYEMDKKGGVKMEQGRPKAKTSHTLNPVPFIISDPEFGGRYRLRDDLPRRGLANVAATVLDLLGYAAPEDYEPSLIRWS
ncbi:MAG: 2,3-bisphosphoglycerate-independent phosphoglycerate mutase [Planctomycetota bacterium]|nr:2,3-bisphosphoglycerate-independent phosphoglycerate mutase [Planctomycetota bacterium]MDW8373832.1 2,3-bisphosphoglycerate-independent phosphoglycerate mutase [Planctomycetota bacterium]